MQEAVSEAVSEATPNVDAARSNPSCATCRAVCVSIRFDCAAALAGLKSAVGDQIYQDALTPVNVSGNHQFEHIAAGYMHTCGLTPEGRAYCWGGFTGRRAVIVLAERQGEFLHRGVSPLR